MNLVEFSLKRRVTVSMIAVALVIFGFVSFTRLPMNLLPDISYPSLTVETRFPGAAPGEVETLVSRPIEEVVGVVAGVATTHLCPDLADEMEAILDSVETGG